MSPKKDAMQTESTVYTFLEVAAGLERRLDRTLSILGLSFREYRLLKKLATVGASGCARIDLAEAVGLTPSAITRALKPLEKLGYATTIRNKRDARQSLGKITSGGMVLFEDARNLIQETLMSLPVSSLGKHELIDFETKLQNMWSK